MSKDLVRRWVAATSIERSTRLTLVLAFLLTTCLPVMAAGSATAQGDVAESEDAVAVVQRVAPAVVTVLNLRQFGGVGSDTGTPAGSGTGFIIDNQGHIVTNNHVVAGGDAFSVILADGTEVEAELIGADSVSDLAVVKIDGDVPAMVPFGDSDQLQPGQTVLAIGSPLGISFSNTVTEGIVSAIGRDFPMQPGMNPSCGTYNNLIQHDAVINPGNSGGPLFDLKGQVVGVNTLGIPTDSQGNPVQGLFFAVPSNTVKDITTRLIEDGEVTYPLFGVVPVAVTEQVAAQADLSVDYGAYVSEASGAAAEAGIEEGDVILELAGQRIDQQNTFSEVLFRHRPGATVDVLVLRGDEQFTAQVRLGERQIDPAACVPQG